MSAARETVMKRLEELSIKYKVTEHEAVFTISQMEKLGIGQSGHVAKNLFLRDAKGKRHFLITLCGDKQADLKTLGSKLGGVRLSFASEERLERMLKLKKGSVTPLGVINDEANVVEIVLDMDLEREDHIGVHPNENTANVWLSYPDLCRYIESCGHSFTSMEI